MKMKRMMSSGMSVMSRLHKDTSTHMMSPQPLAECIMNMSRHAAHMHVQTTMTADLQISSNYSKTHQMPPPGTLRMRSSHFGISTCRDSHSA